MNITSRSLDVLREVVASIPGCSRRARHRAILGTVLLCSLTPAFVSAQQAPPSSYSPVVITEDFATIMRRMSAAKPQIMQRQQQLLESRYDLGNRPAPGVTMSRGKAVQEGVRVKLPSGMTWERLDAMTPEQILDRDTFPAGFLPLPHPNHPEGGMVFPQFHIDEIKKQEATRPDALRSRLRPAGSFPAGVPAADLPDDAARSRATSRRASWSRSTTTTSCSTAS